MRPLPLLILTGFLGSGKTTVLRQWLSQTSFPLKKTAVLINDFGEVNVDAVLLAEKELAMSTITGGCACCQSFTEMMDQILVFSRQPQIELAWIETSGLADPEEIIDHLTSPQLQGHALLRRVIMVIDGTDYPCSWRGRSVQEEQIRYADLLLLNKTDLLTEKERLQVETSLRKLNPQASLISTDHGRVDPTILSREGIRVGIAESTCCDHKHAAAHAGEHSPIHEVLPHAASTFFIPLPHPISRSGFIQFLNNLPPAVFRAKGFVQFMENSGEIHAFQKVRNQAETLLLPLEKAQPSTLGLVLIGPQLPEDEIRRQAGQWLT